MKLARLAGIATLLLLAGCREPNGLPGAVPATTLPDARSRVPATAPVRIDAGPVEKAEAVRLCNLEYVNDVAFGSREVRVRGDFLVRGWLGDESGGEPLDPALLLLDAAGADAYRLPLQRRQPRADVAQAFPGKSGLANSGFELKVAAATLPGGRFHLLLAYRIGDRLRACDNGRQLELAKP